MSSSGSSMWLEYQCRGSRSDKSCMAWSNVRPSVLAVGNSFKSVDDDGGSSRSVSLHRDEGDAYDGGDDSLQRQGPSALSNPTEVAWHPSQMCVLTGYDDGTVATWAPDANKKLFSENRQVHSKPIVAMKWSPDGKRFITCGDDCKVGIWKMDSLAMTAGPKPVMIKTMSWPKNRMNQIAFRTSAKSAITGCMPFFVGGDTGVVMLCDDCSQPQEVMNVKAPIQAMFFYHARDSLIVVTKTNFVLRFDADPDAPSKFTQTVRFKLSTGPSAIPNEPCALSITWMGKGMLATAGNESMVRVWDLDEDENYVLPSSLWNTPDGSDEDGGPGSPSKKKKPKSIGGAVSSTAGPKIVSVAYNAAQHIIAGGSVDGSVFLWSAENASRSRWKGVASINKVDRLGAGTSQVMDMSWQESSGTTSLAVQLGTSVVIVNQTILQKAYGDDTAVLQTSTTDLAVVGPISDSAGSLRMWNSPPASGPCPSSTELKCGTTIKGIQLFTKVGTQGTKQQYMLVQGRNEAEIYEIGAHGAPPSLQKSVPFADLGEVTCCALFNADTVWVGLSKPNRVYCVNSKDAISFTEEEGVPKLLDVAPNGTMAVCTSNNVLAFYKISSGKTKYSVVMNGVPFIASGAQSSSPLATQQQGSQFSVNEEQTVSITDIKLNVSCKNLAILTQVGSVSSGSIQPSTIVSVYSLENNTFSYLDFAPSIGRYPTSISWDVTDPRLFACETRTHASAVSKYDEQPPEVMITTLFVTQELQGGAVVVQDSVKPAIEGSTVLSVNVPNLFFFCPGSASDSTALNSPGDGRSGSLPTTYAMVMRDFQGMDTESMDKDTRDNLVEFSYNLTLGNMDEAYNAVKQIRNPLVWSNMSRICIKTRRLDVAEICLGNMKHVRAARAVRESKGQPDNVRLALVAVHLGQLDDAERLYLDCEPPKYDMLVQLYTASGQWDKAIAMASKHDRIHLRTTHFQYAKHLESIGEAASAAEQYRLADTHRTEVPRMYYDLQRFSELEQYVVRSADQDLLKWWAQFQESKGDFPAALDFYTKAEDHVSQVRVHCFCDEINLAEDVAHQSNHPAAHYHLARHYEAHQMFPEAIKAFRLAERYNHAVRICKELGENQQLYEIALQASNELRLEAAEFLESSGDVEHAVMLFRKGGDFSRAISLCFKRNLFDELHSLVDDLGDNSDPRQLVKCGDFLVNNREYAKGVNLYITAGELQTALDLCMQHDVQITEDMAEKLTPPKSSESDVAAKEARKAVLENIARICKKQGSYQLACKKYTQAGDKVKAMRTLLKSGDTERIIFFAGVCKSKDIYLLAANYLQNLDWHSNPDVMKAIIQFYTKAKAPESLALFYDACAQVEIDQYQDYNKAKDALKQAQTYMAKTDSEDKVQNLNTRIALVERFLQAKEIGKQHPTEMVQQCEQLLEIRNSDAAVRAGDLYATIISHWYTVNDMDQAHTWLGRMQQRGIRADNFLTRTVVDSILEATGNASPPQGRGQQQQQQHWQDEDGEEMDEEIASLDEDMASDEDM